MPARIVTTRNAWVEEGLRSLAEGGPDAVRIESLASRLGVTKGGFYGHFEGRLTFLDAMLDTWETATTEDVIMRVEAEGGDARAKAVRAGALTFSDRLLPVDLAVRDWARRDTGVAKRLQRVDNRRMDYLRSLFAQAFEDPDEIEARSTLAFTFAIGHHFMAADHGGRSRNDMVDLVADRLGLRERADPE